MKCKIKKKQKKHESFSICFPLDLIAETNDILKGFMYDFYFLLIRVN